MTMRRFPLVSLAALGGLAALLVAPLGCATGGGPAASPGVGSVAAGPSPPSPDPNDPSFDPNAAANGPPKITLGQRAQAALEGLVMGAVIGAGTGTPIGAAIGAGTMLVYGAATGNSPFSGGFGSMGGANQSPSDGGVARTEAERERQLEAQLEREVGRGEALELEIEEELRRQEELLRAIEEAEKNVQAGAAAAPEPPAPTLSPEELAERTDPRAAPFVPEERELPLAIFEKQRKTIGKRDWGYNRKKLEVVEYRLDADRDGMPEEVRYHDAESRELIRMEHDRDYDGAIDSWSRYAGGQLIERELDVDADGEVDAWERFSAGRMVQRSIDRDSDGVRDAFYRYENGSLVEERLDANNDGSEDSVVTYADRQQQSRQEDRDRNGRMDAWTSYQVVEGVELPLRVERDTRGDGRPDVFESYEAVNGEAVLSRREEDVNGDGEIDITSIYEKGKLVSREISDPSLSAL